MKTELEKFNHTVDVLVKAYLNDTLIHGNCHACVVGNMVAESLGYTYDRLCHWNESHLSYWDDVFMTALNCDNTISQEINPDSYIGQAKKEIDSTGYTFQDLAKIEKAFESVSRIYNKEERMFIGLMAVIDILAEIHSIDLTVKEKSKLLFVKS